MDSVEIEQKCDKIITESNSDEYSVRVPQICVEDWQEAMFIQNTDRFCFVSSEYISKFYTEFAVQLQKRYEQYDSCMELAHEIKAYVGNAFEEKSFPSIENIFGLRLNSVLNKEFKFDCIEPDYSLFFAMDCIAQWILTFGTSDDNQKKAFALKVCSELMERPRRFWPIFAARVFEQSPSAIPVILTQPLSPEDKVWALKIVEFYSSVLGEQKRSSHPNDIMLAGCWLRNACTELSQATFDEDLFFLEVITVFLVSCTPLILESAIEWHKTLTNIRLCIAELDTSNWQVSSLIETIQDIEKEILEQNHSSKMAEN